MSRVTLVDYLGNDESIALAAWTSTSRELTKDKKNRIPQMVTTLYNEGHFTCFERGIIHLLVETDIASHIHILKHRHIGTNAESARYKELKEDKSYYPHDWNLDNIGFIKEDIRFKDTLFGQEDWDTWNSILEKYTQLGNHLYHQALLELTPILGRKRAKESARYFKTYNSVITTDVIMNMNTFNNFYKLRHSPKAQLEISEIAQEIMDVVKNIGGKPFKVTLGLIEAKYGNQNK